MSEYTAGGYIPTGPTSYRLHPDECVITGHPMTCRRPDHPTPTSECTKHLHGIHHVTEEPA